MTLCLRTACLTLSLLGLVPPSLAIAAPAHYVFVNRDRGRIHDAAFLGTTGIAGAEIKYTWKELEPERDHYALAPVLHDLAFLERHGKRLVVQLQDVTFDERINVPAYLLADPAFHGGAARKYEARDNGDSARFDGWVARRWDPAVQERYARLLRALADSLDGRIEALVLPETSTEFSGGPAHMPAGFTPESWRDGIRAQMSAARAAFQRSRIIQYANFMPGEWLPGDDHGYLRAVYAHADSIRAGVGGPDLIPTRRGFRAHSYPLITARRRDRVCAGLAVQDDNLAAVDPVTKQRVTVPMLAAFAADSLQLDYVFWGQQEPYYSRDVLPWLRAQAAPGR
ncbi:MAG: hypothetical protein ABL977_07460 [Candidatus Eisenbacteria bacterium]